jgi:hypothetical protein
VGTANIREVKVKARHGRAGRGSMSAVAASVAAAGAALAMPPARAAEPIRVAVFAFEYQDVSGGSGIISQDAIDTEYLKQATEEARRLLSASGRYSIVDTTAVAGDAALAQGVQHCNGCEAALAKKLGADQSMAGLFTRMTRMEYTLQVVIRDAQSGELVSNHFTGLRMGANYSWPRAVKWLMDNQILASQRAR